MNLGDVCYPGRHRRQPGNYEGESRFATVERIAGERVALRAVELAAEKTLA